MPEHDEFLQAIFDDPADHTTRLVYADWLEEQGDPGGELIRLRHVLSSLPARDRRRKQLLRRERELIALADEDWLILLERADWKIRYQALEIKSVYKSRWSAKTQSEIGRALRKFEGEIRHRLPRSYKAYAHVFGPGDMAEYFRIKVPLTRRKSYDLAAEHKRIWKACNQDWTGSDEWLKQAIFFGHNIEGEAVIWDTATVCDPLAHEYRVCWLNRLERIHRQADSFPAFIDDICLRVFDEEGLETPQRFTPYEF